MKKSLFGVKKATSTIIATLIIGTNNAFAGGIPVIDLSAIANQVKDYAMQLQQYEQLYQQLQQQNLQNLGKYDWENLGTILYQVNNVMNQVNGLSYDIGNVSKKFEDTYKDFTGYSDDLTNATNEKERYELYSDRYKQIAQTNQNTFKGTLQQLELQYQDLQNEDTIISKLKERSEGSKGNLQAIQATNDLITYQIDEVRKLRVTLMNQNNMLTNYLASQNNKDVLDEAKYKKISERKIKDF
ncbi:P-type conjugative transfer protein TrbJ [Campylobacter jejuni]|nr:P-type conjugative transfer protein TrbJ [Campylobacter jejuni]